MAVETKLARFAVETNPPIAGNVERYPRVPRPITVEVSCEAKYVVDTKFDKFAVETKEARLAVEIWEAKFAVETRLARLAVDTKFTRFALEIYPTEPKPITVDVN